MKRKSKDIEAISLGGGRRSIIKKKEAKKKKQQGERESRGAATGPDRDSKPLALATSLDLAIAKL